MDINQRNQKPETRNQNRLKGRRILITAGPTWVPIDSVRVISNIASGLTGIILAEKLLKAGAKVTLVLGPVPNVAFLRSIPSGSRSEAKAKTTFGIENRFLNIKIKLLPFRFFNELKNIITREIRSKKYDIMIHSAAVSDYKPKNYSKQKVKSEIKEWRLKLVPTTKIIELVRKIAPHLFLIGFKFNPEAPKRSLIKEANKLKQRTNLNLTVANTIKKNRYLAYILNGHQIHGPWFNRKELAQKLVNLIENNYGRTKDTRKT